ncbi:SET and MYND domain-containing protein 1-like, partial [Tropilaelaps mercedesae]
IGYGTGGLLGQFSGGQFPGGSVSQFHDPYLASGSAPAGAHLSQPSAANKNSISTRFRSFMNSLFFRRSTAVSPAFYQGGSSPYGIPGATGASASPFGLTGRYPGVGHPHGFPSKIFSAGSGAYSSQPPGGTYPAANGPVKTTIGASVPSKPNSYQTSASSLVPSVQKASVLPVPATSITSSATAGPSPALSISRPSNSAGAFYPSAASAPGPSFDKAQFSSLYGTNGFTAKASPIGSSHQAKSSKSLKASAGPAMETVEGQSSSFQPVAGPSQQQQQVTMKASISPMSVADAMKSNHKDSASSVGKSIASIHSVHKLMHSSTEAKDSTEQLKP